MRWRVGEVGGAVYVLRVSHQALLCLEGEVAMIGRHIWHMWGGGGGMLQGGVVVSCP
jgi:hypothetical protein